MPFFAYRCRACGEEFQTLVMSGETPVCQRCESADLDQQLSLIASPHKGGDGGAGAHGDTAPCGADMGACCGGCPALADA